MSARKKKTASTPQETLDTIKDLLIKAKPKLDDSRPDNRMALVDDLHRIAFLAETLTEHRSRSKKSLVHVVDLLDREGVLLWNTSGIYTTPDDDGGRTVVAALRLAAFRLIEAGLEQKPGIESLIHVLQLASKTGTTLAELGSKDVAASVLTCAAKYEELLRQADDSHGTHHQAKARATVIYFSSRMEAAWREGNADVAEFMLSKITEDYGEYLALLLPHDRELLASKLLEIGKSGLKSSIRQGKNTNTTDQVRTQDAVRWMQKAFSMTEQLDDSATPSITELKRLILRSLARAYFLSSSDDPENLARADAALQELVTSLDESTDHASSEYQQLRWMRLAILKRRKVGDSALLDAFRSIIDNMTFSEGNITDVLQELRTLVQQHTLVTNVTLYCLRRTLEPSRDASGLAFVDRLLFSLIIHCSKDDDHMSAMKDLDTAFRDISEADFELPRTPTAACLTLLWKYGNREYNAKKWSDAAGWFLAGSHQIFQSMGQTSSSKCFRKAALCYIQHREFATASAVIRRCPSHEATTNYVILLAAVHQGLEDEAIRAIGDIVRAPDFDRRMLQLATQLSHESDMKTLLLTVLEALLKTVTIGDKGETVVDGMTLIRCIIRLILRLLAEPTANKRVLIDMLIQHFATAKTMVATARVRKELSMIAKDISWLWRAAYNCAVEGCSKWEQAEDQLSDLFDVSRELLEAYCEEMPMVIDVELHLHIVIASFAAVSGRVFAARRTLSECGSMDQDKLRRVAADIQATKRRTNGIIHAKKLQAPDDALRVKPFIHILHVFEVEILARLQDWDQLLKTIREVTDSDASAANTFEAIADVVWVAKDCPVDVTFSALEAILHASLDRGSLSVEKFSRWLRATCLILLARNMAPDRGKAIGYVEQAITVMEEYAGSNTEVNELYPMDERQWLLATSYNTGIECLHASLLDEAKRWFEASTVICRFVPDGQTRAQKISETYTHLLTRYSRGKDRSMS